MSAALVSAFLMLSARQAWAEGRRVALVIGVGAYENVPKLPNAVNDANAIAEMFRSAGFEVVATRNDANNLNFKRAIREFEDSANDADIAVVYYAGHGIEIGEANYLIPTDAKLVNERDAEDEAVPLDRIVKTLEGAKSLRLVILDACRDNPFANKIKRRVATRAITAGLGKAEPQQSNTLIAYAAKAQAVANDGEGAHSPFTTALLTSLTVPGLDIRLAFGRVRDDVLKATNRQQEPYVYGSLGGSTVALVPTHVEVASLTPISNLRDEDARAQSDYEIVERVGTKAAWEVYLNTHKTGLYAELAREQLAKLAGSLNVLVARKPTPAQVSAWDKLKMSTNATAIAKFIETYKDSPLVPEAQERLALVRRLAEEEEELRKEREAMDRQREEEKKVAKVEHERLEKAAALQREEEKKAKAAEILQKKAEALAAAKQKEAEGRARAADEAARRSAEQEAARLAEVALRKEQAEEHAKILKAQREQREAERNARKQATEDAARALAEAKAVREAEEKAQRQALKDKQQQEADRAIAAVRAAGAQETEDRKRLKQETALQLEGEKKARADEIAQKKDEIEQRRRENADGEKAKYAEEVRRKAAVNARAERERADKAAAIAANQKAARAAATQRSQEVEEQHRKTREAAAANRKREEAAVRRADELRAVRVAQAARIRAMQAAQYHSPRPPRDRPVNISASQSGGGGGSSIMGIGF
ncbi:caspase family protein [Methylobacterium sp. WL7]|uniref:caspase family protein n=1 Tax=Methylobacterium sp. WL7 TaxID=2603900 RepID=UPI0016505585|nr:caspase family protein [Methylobacterium sp. WL7]